MNVSKATPKDYLKPKEYREPKPNQNTYTDISMDGLFETKNGSESPAKYTGLPQRQASSMWVAITYGYQPATNSNHPH
jgi:hypothetical protein